MKTLIGRIFNDYIQKFLAILLNLGIAKSTDTFKFFQGMRKVLGHFIQRFASGGTLLDFNPPDYREFIKTQREKLGTRSGAVRPAASSAAPATRSA